jgi:hypothetical protein
LTDFRNLLYNDFMMTFELDRIERINHVAKLCRKHKLDRAGWLREAQYHLKLARNTALKAYDGETDLSMEVVEKIAYYFEVTKDEVLETVIK